MPLLKLILPKLLIKLLANISIVIWKGPEAEASEAKARCPARQRFLSFMLTRNLKFRAIDKLKTENISLRNRLNELSRNLDQILADGKEERKTTNSTTYLS